MMRRLIQILLPLVLAACGRAPIPVIASATPSASATPPATPTQTLEPTPIATAISPTPLPRFFTEEFDGALPAWSVLQSNREGAPDTRIDGGALVFELNQAYQWTYAIIGAQEYTDVRVDAVLQSRGTGPDAIGVLCRYSEANGWYEFNVSSDGSYSVLFGQWLKEGIASYAPIASDYSQYLQPGGAQNEIGLGCEGDTLWLYLNGKLFRKLDVSRFGLTMGRLGLSAASFENVPVIAAFDRVRVSAP
jgi:hypothetical protein